MRPPTADRGYDYRHHWTAVTRRIGQLHRSDELARELAGYIRQTLGASSTGIYLAADDHAAYRLRARVGGTGFVRSLAHWTGLSSWFRLATTPASLPAEYLPLITAPPLQSVLGMPLRWRTSLLGFIVLGARREGRDYGDEDLELLATVAEQAAPAIMAARLSEMVRVPRGIEDLDRRTTGVIHDLKNAVSALSLLARNAASNLADPLFQRDAVATLWRTVDRMRRALGALSATDPAPPATRTEPVDLRDLIVEATIPLAADAKIRLVRQLESISAVYGDRDALLRVVENLTTNAAEAIDDEGTVTVTLAEEQGHAVISVADTGCGMSEEYQEHRLFAPFSSTKRGGWGVGLYQTKQAVEAQDGEIFVESVEGRGTTFTVKLPLRADVECTSLESVR